MVRILMVATLMLAASPALGQMDSSSRQIPAAEIGSKTLILGDLGVPIGEAVTISGEKRTNGPLANQFWVDTINGKKLAGVRGILVKGISHWPNGTHATLGGHEVGTIRFRSAHDGNEPDDKQIQPRQIIFLTFHVEKIEPKNLKLESK